MRHKRAQIIGFVMLAAVALAQTPSNNPFPIRNGVLQNDLNANNFKIQNLDTSNLGLGGGGSGIDTGTTTAIIKGNGAHGIADAVAGTDYLLPTGSGILLTGVVLTASNLSDLADAATARTNLGLGNVDNTSDADKPVSTATATALGLKADAAAMATALAAKYDTATATTALAGKEPTLPTTGIDNYILARDADGTWHFVDPITLGTTSQTYTDGVENSTTTFTSATANFVASDVGKTITGDNIPASTTIASRTNSTTIILSAAATATGSGNTFTILNRLEVGGTGTVTSVGVTNNASALLTLTLSNPTSSASLTFDTPAVGANTFYGNSAAFTSVPSFMTASAARTALGLGTLALQANTGTSIALQKGNGTGGLSAAVAGTDYLTPTGSGTGLTGVVKTANNLSDVNAALAKSNLGLAPVASSGSFFDLTAPVVGTNTFYGNPTGVTASAVFMTASAARTALGLGTPAVDFAKDTAQTGTNAAIAWTSGVTNFIETAALTANRTRTLPPTTGYADGTTIKYFDAVTTGLFGPLFLPAGSDTLKGANAAAWAALGNYAPFTGAGFGGGSKSITFQKRGTDWQVYAFGGESLSIKSVQSQTNLNGIATFTATSLTTSRNIAMPDADMALMAATDHGLPGVLVDINTDGTATKSVQHPTNLVPSEEAIGAAGTVIGDTLHSVTNDGTKDTVRIAGTLTTSYQIKWPSAGNYSAGETVTLLDASGSVSNTTPVTITSTNGTDTFSGQSSFIFDETSGRKAFTSDGVGSWTVSSTKTSTQPFRVITPVGSTFTVVSDQNSGKQNAHLNLLNGVNTLAITNPYDGMPIELVLVQPASGSAATLALPIGSRTAAGGAGLVTLTATNGAIDRLKGSYEGTLAAFLWDPVVTNETSSATPNAPSALAATAINANEIDLAWTDNSASETGFAIERALGASGTGFNQIATVAANVVTYADTTVSAATGYNYRVRAFNAGGYSSYSAADDATTTSGGPTADLLEWHFNEGTLNAVGATAGPAGTMSQAAWTTSTQSASGAAFAPIIGMGNTAGLTVTTVGTAGTTSYSYKVLAWKTSTSVHNTYLGAAVTVTTGNATLTGANYNHITWTAVTGADYYEVYRTVSAGSPSTTGRLTVPGTGTSVTGTSLDDVGLLVNGATPSNLNSTDIYTVTAGSNVTYGQSISVSFWAKADFNSGGGTAPIIAGNTGVNVFRISCISGNKLQITFPRSTGTETGTVSDSVTSNGSAVNSGTTWHHIVVEMDNSGATQTGNEIKVYYDGNNPQTVTYTATGSGGLTFPASAPVVGTAAFAGAIDDVRIYGHLLTTTEITNLFSGNAQ